MMFPKTTLLLLFSIITYTVNAQNVGIGTANPVNKLSVNGKVNITDSLAIGVLNPVGELHVQSNRFSTSSIEQTTYSGTSSLAGAWQSFTATVTGLLSKVDLYVSSPIYPSFSYGTLKIYSGEGISGSMSLSTTSVTLQPGFAVQSFTLSNSVNVIAGNKYTIHLSVPVVSNLWIGFGINNPYAGGISNLNTNYDLFFKAYITSPNILDALVVSNGNVGIGITTPSSNLDIAGNIKITDGTQGVGKVLTSDANGLASWVTPTVMLAAGTAAGNTTYWNGTNWVANSSNIYNNGTNVGIGTTTPSAKFEVIGNVKIADGTEAVGKVLTSDANGLASWITPAPGLNNGTANGNTPYWNGINWVTNSGNIYNNGINVGIGTSSPSSKLDIAGNIKIVDGTQGAGKVLTSDANGLASWTTPTMSAGSAAGNTPYWNGTNWITNSSNIFNNGGNVGIGAATPGNKLSVAGSADFTGKVGIGTASPVGDLHIKTSASFSTPTIDQQQISSIDNVAAATLNWQSFTAGITGNLTRVDLYVGSPTGGSARPGTIKIYSGEGNGGTLLSTTSVSFANPIEFKAFGLSAPVSLIAGNKYTIEFSTDFYSAGWAAVSNSNAYPAGITNAANTWPNWDFLFKTYVTPFVDAFVVTDGKVGIGTTNPQANLHIESANTSGPAGLIKLNSPNMTAGNITGIVQGRNGSLANQAEWVFSYLGDGNLNNYQGFGFNAIQPFVAFTASERVGIGTTVPTAKLSVNGSANNSTGSWGVFSDARIKTVNSDFTDGLNVINKIHTVKFNYNANAPFSQKAEQIGIVAQELEKIAPYMVSQKEFGNIKDLREVDNQAYVFLLINAIKELSAQNEQLKKEFSTQNEQLKKELDLIKSKLGL